MSYRNKTYVCFDADTDINYYNLMKGWKENKKIDFNFHNAYDLTNVGDESSEETIKRKLKEIMINTTTFIVLIGGNTKNLQNFVGWEQDIAIEMELPIIAVNLNGKKQRDVDLCPSIIKNELAIHIPFGVKIIQYALDNWPSLHSQNKNDGKTGPFHYNESI